LEITSLSISSHRQVYSTGEPQMGSPVFCVPTLGQKTRVWRWHLRIRLDMLTP